MTDRKAGKRAKRTTNDVRRWRCPYCQYSFRGKAPTPRSDCACGRLPGPKGWVLVERRIQDARHDYLDGCFSGERSVHNAIKEVTDVSDGWQHILKRLEGLRKADRRQPLAKEKQ